MAGVVGAAALRFVGAEGDGAADAVSNIVDRGGEGYDGGVA